MARPDPSEFTVNKEPSPSSKAIRSTVPVAIALFGGGIWVGFSTIVGRTRVARSPAIAVTVATAAISVAAAAVFDSDCCSVTAVGVGVGSGAVAAGSEVRVAATAVEVAGGDVFSVGTTSAVGALEHPTIVSAINALSSKYEIDRRKVGIGTRRSGGKNQNWLRALLRA